MRARFKTLLALIILLLLGTLAVGFFYTVYTRYLNGEPEIKIVGNLSINYQDGVHFYVRNEKNIHFSIINNSDKEEYYFIGLKKVQGVSDVSYTITKNDKKGGSTKMPSSDDIISNYILIEPNSSDTYVLNLKSNQKESFSCELNIDIMTLESTSFAQIILKNNKVKSEPVTIPGKQAAETNEGLIKTIDDYGTAYYFRGAVDNNYVLIDDLMFRIIRINGDGTVSMVLDGNTNVLKKYYEKAGEYQFGATTLNSYLNEWLETNLPDGITYISTYKYCNEYGTDSNNVMNAYTRINDDNIPSLVCLGERVQSKIGLLTVDDVILAGATLNDTNGKFYLYNSKVNTDAYLLTGASLTTNVYYPYILASNGKVVYKTPGTYLRAIRPVVTTFETTSATGNGTVKEPYILTN